VQHWSIANAPRSLSPGSQYWLQQPRKEKKKKKKCWRARIRLSTGERRLLLALGPMGYRSRSRSRSPAAARDGRSDRHRRRSPERRDDRPERGSPSYRPYRERDDRGPYENGARGAGHDWSYGGGYRGEHRNGDDGYGRRRPDDRLPQAFGRRGTSTEPICSVAARAAAWLSSYACL